MKTRAGALAGEIRASYKAHESKPEGAPMAKVREGNVHRLKTPRFSAYRKSKAGASMALHISVPIRRDRDIVTARQKSRELAARLGFTKSESVLIATIVSELARNIVLYATEGEILLAPIEEMNKKGIEIIARDAGPGIPDVERALRKGYSTSGSLGVGLPGVRRLVDEFQIASKPGSGTAITIRKWKP